MAELNRQVNVHLVGDLAEGVLTAIVNKLDCNTHEVSDFRSRLMWLINHANLVILLPGWAGSKARLAEIAVAQELKIEILFLHHVLPDRSSIEILQGLLSGLENLSG